MGSLLPRRSSVLLSTVEKTDFVPKQPCCSHHNVRRDNITAIPLYGKNMKKLVILLILMICAFLCCCGKSGALGAYIKSNPYMELHEDADVDFYDIWDSVDFQEDTDHVPEKINGENFFWMKQEISLLLLVFYYI